MSSHFLPQTGEGGENWGIPQFEKTSDCTVRIYEAETNWGTVLGGETHQNKDKGQPVMKNTITYSLDPLAGYSVVRDPGSPDEEKALLDWIDQGEEGLRKAKAIADVLSSCRAGELDGQTLPTLCAMLSSYLHRLEEAWAVLLAELEQRK